MCWTLRKLNLNEFGRIKLPFFRGKIKNMPDLSENGGKNDGAGAKDRQQ